MPKDKPRENQRHDVWLTDDDMQRVNMFAEMMRQAGLNPNNQFGKVSISKVIQWVLNGQSMKGKSDS